MLEVNIPLTFFVANGIKFSTKRAITNKESVTNICSMHSPK